MCESEFNEDTPVDFLPTARWVQKLDVSDETKKIILELCRKRRCQLRGQRKEEQRQLRTLQVEQNRKRRREHQAEKRAAAREAKRQMHAEEMEKKIQLWEAMVEEAIS